MCVCIIYIHTYIHTCMYVCMCVYVHQRSQFRGTNWWNNGMFTGTSRLRVQFTGTQFNCVRCILENLLNSLTNFFFRAYKHPNTRRVLWYETERCVLKCHLGAATKTNLRLSVTIRLRMPQSIYDYFYGQFYCQICLLITVLVSK